MEEIKQVYLVSSTVALDWANGIEKQLNVTIDPVHVFRSLNAYESLDQLAILVPESTFRQEQPFLRKRIECIDAPLRWFPILP